jgi:hypothetical protein
VCNEQQLIPRQNQEAQFAGGKDLWHLLTSRTAVHRTYVSRVARGERQSEAVEKALIDEYKRISGG